MVHIDLKRVLNKSCFVEKYSYLNYSVVYQSLKASSIQKYRKCN